MIIVSLIYLCTQVHGLKVMVTGAGGRTGKLVFEQLSNDYEDVEPLGLVRSAKSKNALLKKMKDSDLDETKIITADVTAKDKSLEAAMSGCDAIILCTSAVPKIKPWSIVKVMFKKLLRKEDVGRPEFSFPENGTPEEVDWLGAKAQIEAAKAAGVKHFVFVSSMGGTQPDNFLNTIGKVSDGTGGDILLWKRKAEKFLVESGLDYTIIHPGGLIDEEPAKREIVVGLDDVLLKLKSRSIPRADVARVCCAALFDERAKNKSFDIATKPIGEGKPTVHAKDVFGILVLQHPEQSADYSIELPEPPSIFATSSLSSSDSSSQNKEEEL